MWAILRLALGNAQMAGAVATGILLYTTGLSPWTLALGVGTCFLTTVSVFLFGRRRG